MAVIVSVDSLSVDSLVVDAINIIDQLIVGTQG
jgi:hypothetical protein